MQEGKMNLKKRKKVKKCIVMKAVCSLLRAGGFYCAWTMDILHEDTE
jgi:hypothetical protein